MPTITETKTEKQISSHNLDKHAMLIDIDLHGWGANVKDAEISDRIAREEQSDKTLGRFTKTLCDGPQIKAIRAIDSEIRKLYYTWTLPWKDKAWRLIESEKFFDFSEEVRALQDKRQMQVNILLAQYLDLKELDKVRVANYKESDYPSLEKLRSRYRCEVHTDFLPDLDDIRTKLRSHEVDSIRKEQMEKELDKQIAARDERIKYGIKSVIARIQALVKTLADTLKAAGTEKGRFKDTLVDNIKDLLGTIPTLNITNDQELNDLAEEAKEQLTYYDGPTLREDYTTRQEIARRADAIYNKMSAYFA